MIPQTISTDKVRAFKKNLEQQSFDFEQNFKIDEVLAQVLSAWNEWQKRENPDEKHHNSEQLKERELTEIVRIIRVLVYQGDCKWLGETLANGAVPANGRYTLGNGCVITSTTITGFPEVVISHESEEV